MSLQHPTEKEDEMRRMRMMVPILAAGAWIFAAERLLSQPATDPASIKAAES